MKNYIEDIKTLTFYDVLYKYFDLDDEYLLQFNFGYHPKDVEDYLTNKFQSELDEFNSSIEEQLKPVRKIMVQIYQNDRVDKIIIPKKINEKMLRELL